MAGDQVIVFGGSGFLGSHVADALSDAGYRVRIFDCTSSAFLRPDQEMVQGDIMNSQAVLDAAKDCRYVYNFAGLADIDDARNRPYRAAELNILGNLNALEAARQNNAERFIFASTVYVYSDSGSFYRASKQSAERFVETYQERYGVNYTILRYGSLYGRRADLRNGIFRLLTQALEKKALTYKGSGDAMREYIHVSDAARLSVRILEEGFKNRHIIITGHERMTVRNLLKMIAEMLPETVNVEFGAEQMYGHYEMTPYAFHPRVGHKLVANDYVDLGQGLLDCLAELHEKSHKQQHAEDDWLVVDHEESRS